MSMARQIAPGWIAVAAAATLALASGCGSSSSGGESSTKAAGGGKSTVQPSGDASTDKLAQVLGRGTLILFTDPKYPPQSFAVEHAKRPASMKCAANELTAAEIAGYDADSGKL